MLFKLLNFTPLLLAIICYVLAGAFAKQADVHSGLLLLAGGLAGWSIPRLGDMFRRDPSRDPQAGHVDTVAILVVICVSLLLLIAAYAHADTPISKCWTKVCAEPQVSISVVEYNLATRKVGAGILPVGSVGYGVRDANDYIAAGVFLSTGIGGGQPNYVAPAILFRFMRAITLGAQVRVGEDATQWSLLAGGGLGL